MNEIRESSCKTHTPQCDCKWCNYVRGIEHDQEARCTNLQNGDEARQFLSENPPIGTVVLYHEVPHQVVDGGTAQGPRLASIEHCDCYPSKENWMVCRYCGKDLLDSGTESP